MNESLFWPISPCPDHSFFILLRLFILQHISIQSKWTTEMQYNFGISVDASKENWLFKEILYESFCSWSRKTWTQICTETLRSSGRASWEGVLSCVFCLELKLPQMPYNWPISLLPAHTHRCPKLKPEIKINSSKRKYTLKRLSSTKNKWV